MDFNGMQFVDRLLEVAKNQTGENQTQGKIADRIGIDPKTISGWRNGAKPNAEYLLKISKTYNCSIDYLLGIDNKQLNEPHTLHDLLRNIFIYDMRNTCPIKIVFDYDLEHRESSIHFFEIEEDQEYKVYSAIKEYKHTSNAFQYINDETAIQLIDGILEKNIPLMDK